MTERLMSASPLATWTPKAELRETVLSASESLALEPGRYSKNSSPPITSPAQYPATPMLIPAHWLLVMAILDRVSDAFQLAIDAPSQPPCVNVRQDIATGSSSLVVEM